jgi:hypothetical protein
MWPTFFYGQAYMGSLDASLVAGAFALFGPQVLAIRLVQLVLYTATVLTTVRLGSRILGPGPAIMAGLLMAVPTVNVTLYSTVSLGGYGEAFLIGNLIMLSALAIFERPDGNPGYLAWGFLSGLGLWAFGLSLIYVVPSGLVVGQRLLRGGYDRRRQGSWSKLGLMGLGAVVGASPWITSALRNGIEPLLSELSGSAIAGASPAGFFASIAGHTFNLALFGTTVIFGLRPPWEVRWLAPVLMPVVVAFWLGATISALRGLRGEGIRRSGLVMLVGVCVCLLAGFILTPFGADPSGRYFTPLAAPMAIFGAGMLDGVRQRLGGSPAWLLLGLVLIFNLWGTIDSALRQPPGLTTQFDPNTIVDHSYDRALMDFLSRQQETRGYTTYWVAYPLAFLSSEAQIFVPRLPYHPDLRYTPRDDRYAPYDSQVAAADKVAYITTGQSTLDSALEAYFSEMKVDYAEVSIGDYHVYYSLSKRVPPPDFTHITGE